MQFSHFQRVCQNFWANREKKKKMPINVVMSNDINNIRSSSSSSTTTTSSTNDETQFIAVRVILFIACCNLLIVIIDYCGKLSNSINHIKSAIYLFFVCLLFYLLRIFAESFTSIRSLFFIIFLSFYLSICLSLDFLRWAK